MAWIFAPTSISYSDGISWTSQQYGECFQALWRDAEHLTLEVLPTLQFETNDDCTGKCSP